MHPPHRKSAGDGPTADASSALQFPTVLEYIGARTYAQRRADGAWRFSAHKVFVNNGDTFNAGHVIRRFQDATTGESTDGEDDATAEGTTDGLGESAGPGGVELDGLGLLTRKQYETFLDRPSAATKIGYLRRVVGSGGGGRRERPRGPVTSPGRPRHTTASPGGRRATTVFTTLRNTTAAGGPLSGCRVVAKDDADAWRSALMQCAVAVFDVTGGTDDELRDARAAFGHVHGELMKCGDEQLTRLRDRGEVRCFVLVSTAATWAERGARVDEYGGDEGEGGEEHRQQQQDEQGAVAGDEGDRTASNPLHRAPVVDRHRAVFELEKSVLRANATRTGAVFRGRVVAAGVTYGHGQRALRRVFECAWLGAGDDAAARRSVAELGRFTVPAVHVDELAELVRVTAARARATGAAAAASPQDRDREYALAVERPSYEFADIANAVYDEFCDRPPDDDDRPTGPGRRAPPDMFRRCRTHGQDGVMDPPPPADDDEDRYGLGDRFALDLILSDLDADHPALQNFIARPTGGYGTGRSPLVPSVRRLAREYVDARGLRPYRLLVSGRPRREAARVAERLARRYRVRLVNVRGAADDRLDRLRGDGDRLRAALHDVCRRRAAAVRLAAAAEATEDEWAADEATVDHETMISLDGEGRGTPRRQNEHLESSDDDGYCFLHDDDDELERQDAASTTGDDVLAGIDREIRKLKRALTDLNDQREQLERDANAAAEPGRPDDPVNLLPLIGESLSSCACRNRGYVVNVFPLTVERMDAIFDGVVDCPSAIVMLSYDPYGPGETAAGPTAAASDDDDYDDDDDDENRRSVKCDSGSSEVDDSDGSDRQDDCRDIDVDTDDDGDDDGAEANENENSINEKNDRGYVSAAETKRVVDYFTDRRCKVLRMKVPFWLIDETASSELQYTKFTDSIVSLVGRPLFADDVYVTETDTRRTTAENDLREAKIRAREKSRTVSEKLGVMREQWNDDILKAIERDKLCEHGKKAKFQNYVYNNVLSKLLKEISSIGNGDSNSFSRFPEKLLNKSKLCRTRPDED